MEAEEDEDEAAGSDWWCGGGCGGGWGVSTRSPQGVYSSFTYHANSKIIYLFALFLLNIGYLCITQPILSI